MSLTKIEALQTVLNEAKQYNKRLVNKKFIFIFDDNKKFKYIETCFYKHNFLHLTGLTITRKIKSPNKFFDDCLKNRISPNDFEFTDIYTTELKIKSLHQISHIDCICKMIGDYNHTKPWLYAEKLIGNITVCLGFVEENGVFVPSSSIADDIRDLTIKSKRIIAVLSKNTELKYNKISYLAKGIKLRKENFTKEIIDKIDETLVITT